MRPSADLFVYRINQYFDGKRSDDEILFRAEITRRQLREVLHHYEPYVSPSVTVYEQKANYNNPPRLAANILASIIEEEKTQRIHACIVEGREPYPRPSEPVPIQTEVALRR